MIRKQLRKPHVGTSNLKEFQASGMGIKRTASEAQQLARRQTMNSYLEQTQNEIVQLKNQHRHKIIKHERNLDQTEQNSKNNQNSTKKIDINKNAQFETQIISQPHYSNLSKGTQLNIRKSLDFVLMLKRLYKKKVTTTVFKDWDLSNKNYIDHKNIKDISHFLGFPLNEQESRFIISLYDHDNKGNLNTKDFYRFIKIQDDQQKVDLLLKTVKKNPKEMEQKFLEGFQEIQRHKLLQLIENKIHNQKTILQKEIREHLDQGIDKLDLKQLVFMMRDGVVQGSFISEPELQFYFNNKKSEDGLLDIKKIQDVLKQENIQQITVVKNKQVHKKVEDYEPQINSKTLGINKIEGLFKTLSKMRGRLRGKNLTENEFMKAINQTDQYLTREKLRDFLKDFFGSNQILIKDKEINILIRGMSCDRFNHYKKEQVSQLLFDCNMIEFFKQQTLKEYANELQPTNEFILKPIVANDKEKQLIQQGLDEIKEKLFQQRQHNKDLYRFLDRNSDGFVSGQDIVAYLKVHGKLNETQIRQFLTLKNIWVDKVYTQKDFQEQIDSEIFQLGQKTRQDFLQRDIQRIKDGIKNNDQVRDYYLNQMDYY